ncbi:hypothetical protein PY73_05715, partial [Lacticaseibacillus rhamnosus]
MEKIWFEVNTSLTLRGRVFFGGFGNLFIRLLDYAKEKVKAGDTVSPLEFLGCRCSGSHFKGVYNCRYLRVRTLSAMAKALVVTSEATYVLVY